MPRSSTTRSTHVVSVSPSRPHQPVPASVDPDFLTTEEAAVFLRLSPRTLEKRRIFGGGPRFHTFGRRVRYAVVDLQCWIDRRAWEMTSDPGYTHKSPFVR